jgi:hypothetical protein
MERTRDKQGRLCLAMLLALFGAVPAAQAQQSDFEGWEEADGDERDAEAATEADAEAQPGDEADAQPGAGADAQPGAGADAQPGAGADAQPGDEADAQPGAGADAQPGAGADAQPGAETEPAPAAEPLPPATQAPPEPAGRAAPRAKAEEPPAATGDLLGPLVHSRWGSVRLGGLFQSLLATRLVVKDDDGFDDDTFDTFAFSFQRARLVLRGHLIDEDLTYFFQGDAGNTLGFLLDMWLAYRFRFGGQSLELRAGRFIPEFSYMMPRDKGDLAAVDHPLLLTGPGAFALWRQIGLQATYRPLADLSLVLGMFNGLLNDPFTLAPAAGYQQLVRINNFNNWTDNNKHKDFLLRGAYRMGDLSLDLNLYLGFPTSANDADETDVLFMAGPGAEYDDGRLHLVGEFLYRVIALDSPIAIGPLGQSEDEIHSLAFWGHFGMRISDLVEVMARLDWLEPDLDADGDMLMRLTAGVHFWIFDKNFRILANLYSNIPLEQFGDRDVDLGLLIQAAVRW